MVFTLSTACFDGLVFSTKFALHYFHFFQNQLLELKTHNYQLEEVARRKDNEISILTTKLEEVEKELSKVQNLAKLNPLAIAKTFVNKKDAKDKELISQLIAENESLQRRVQSQEEDFQRTSETLRQELHSLMSENSKLEKLANCKNKITSSSDGETSSNALESVPSPANNHVDATASDQIDSSSHNRTSRSLSVQSYSDLAEREKMQNELDSLRRELDEVECQRNNALSKLEETTLELSTKCNEKQSLIQEMKEHMDEMTETHSTEISNLKSQHESQMSLLKEKLNALESVKDELTAAREQIDRLSVEKSDLQVQLQETRSQLKECEVEMQVNSSEHELQVAKLTKEHEDKIEYISAVSKEEVEKWQLLHLEASDKVSTLNKQIALLNQKLSDGLEERKIQEKKGLLLVKEIKKQLALEKKRADKLQSKLSEVLSETSIDTNGLNSTAASMDAKCGLNDSASNSSWSFMSNSKNENTPISSASHVRRPSSLNSFSDPGKDSSPTPISPSTTIATDELEINSLAEDNAQLITRNAELQQEKWQLNEKIHSLQSRLDHMSKEMEDKSNIISYYLMDSRSDHFSGHSAHNSTDKLTVKRLVDFIKDKGDEGQREINRKLQRILEETLTKNMVLQKHLEIISDENVELKKQLSKNKAPVC